MLARFYKREILAKLFEIISKELFPTVISYDHVIIYYEACKVSQKVGILPDAVWHIEPDGLLQLWKKNYRYGQSAKALMDSGYYKELVNKKVRLRKGSLKNLKLGLQANLLLLLKGIAYYTGYFSTERVSVTKLRLFSSLISSLCFLGK
ncbi:MAG: hypothetical protein QW487_07595 [Candidatus Bathyarchaeia archaeon]|nr:hypothetical protein [Candidatus Bathyarchaeota archaeon]